MNNENFHVDGIGGIQIQLADARGSALPCPRHSFADKVVCSNSAMSAARHLGRGYPLGRLAHVRPFFSVEIEQS